jgi:hypothetical protein
VWVEEREMAVPDDAAPDESRPVAANAATGGRPMSLLSIAVFDVGGPLAVYYSLRAAGFSTVVALVVSGLLPAVGIGLSVRRHRRVDAIGVVVLFGILIGTVAGLASGSARLVLIDGTVPTGVLGIVCFASFLTSRPFMYRVALEFTGPETAQGREFVKMWHHPGFRRSFRIITVVWGVTFIAETVAQIAIIEYASASIAKTTSNLMPIAVAALVTAWTVLYGRRQRTRAERAAQTGGAAQTGIPGQSLTESEGQ